MSAPVLLAVDEDERSLRDVERELVDRDSRSYRVVCVSSAENAMVELDALAAAGDDVALVIASLSLGGETASELLGRVRDLHAHAQRGLLIEWGSWGDGRTAEEIFQAMARRQIEYYVIRPSRSPDELFHRSVSTFLLEWAHARRVSPHTVHIVSESWAGRAHELKEVLGRCAVPHAFLLADSPQGRALVAESGGGEPLPLVIFPNGTVLANPTNLELASASGATIDPGQRDYDVVIVGGGPASLSAAVYGASEGFRTLVIDDGGIGGQAPSSSLIRNYLGFPRGSAGAGWRRALTSRPGSSAPSLPSCMMRPRSGAGTTAFTSRSPTAVRSAPARSSSRRAPPIAGSASPRFSPLSLSSLTPPVGRRQPWGRIPACPPG